eukprot:scaffold107891_cov12-Tisochrysis_lutea.AAC.1
MALMIFLMSAGHGANSWFLPSPSLLPPADTCIAHGAWSHAPAAHDAWCAAVIGGFQTHTHRFLSIFLQNSSKTQHICTKMASSLHEGWQ